MGCEKSSIKFIDHPNRVSSTAERAEWSGNLDTHRHSQATCIKLVWSESLKLGRCDDVRRGEVSKSTMEYVGKRRV